MSWLCRKNRNEYNQFLTAKQLLIKNLNIQIESLEQKIIVLKNNIKNLDTDTWGTCPICLDNKINVAIIPCGHTLCNKCLSQYNERCFICREKFDNIIKLYI